VAVRQKPEGTSSFEPADERATTLQSRFRHEVLAVVFQVRGSGLHVLLWQRAREPFSGCWSLPGGPVGDEELLGSSLGRHLATKVDLTDVGNLEQLETRSDIGRDPRERTIATAYVALVSSNVNPSVPDDTAWWPVDELPDTAFDHASIVNSGRTRLRAKLTYTNVAYALAPETFTIAELKAIYVACLGHAISTTNFQRVLLRRKVIEATSEVAAPSPSGGRPASLYRFSQRSLVVTDPFAVFRPPL